ncbi:integrase core domain-containing protein [Leptospira interrogans]|uniref:integrase core domain-containing protein n=1 Tax=Leptospira interrogans TaxID=173 RepID=UPI0002783799|nr:integrase core domain-containing protein [Leptospira interrogans]EJP02268.1 integrase core domain protein [Leptospira interrogans serovar Bulgarica str. Mallika]UID83915.1 integrase core domain-containing protein [Leptospira interrogans]
MNSCSVSDLPWLWFLITENLIFVFLWKFSPKQVLHVFKILKVQWSHFLKLEKKKGRPSLRKYWEKYYHIKDMLVNNITWGASRIHSELLLLGYDISLSSVKRIIRRIQKRNNPFKGHLTTWLNLIYQIKEYTVATDFCRIQTIYGTTLYSLSFIHIASRKIVHLNITTNPTRDWVLKQIQEAKSLFPEFEILLWDNNTLFSGRKLLNGLESLGIQSLHTPMSAPWCNGIMERWFGSVRRECLNHIPIFSLGHAQAITSEYVNYYNFWRPHLALNKDSPCGRAVTFSSYTSKVIKRKVLGELHHVYINVEAPFQNVA